MLLTSKQRDPAGKLLPFRKDIAVAAILLAASMMPAHATIVDRSSSSAEVFFNSSGSGSSSSQGVSQTGDSSRRPLVNSELQKVFQDVLQTPDPTFVFIGFFMTFGISQGQLIETDPTLSNRVTANFLAGLILPDPFMGFEVQFHNSESQDVTFNATFTSPIAPTLQFSDSPVMNATVMAEVFDTGGAAGATADFNVSFFTTQQGFSSPTSIFTGVGLGDIINEGEVSTLDRPEGSFSGVVDDEITDFTTGIFADVSPGDTLNIKFTFGLGDGDTPIPAPLDDNATAKQTLDDAVDAAFAALDGDEEPAPVPLPASGFLVLAGIGMLGAMRRRRANG